MAAPIDRKEEKTTWVLHTSCVRWTRACAGTREGQGFRKRLYIKSYAVIVGVIMTPTRPVRRYVHCHTAELRLLSLGRNFKDFPLTSILKECKHSSLLWQKNTSMTMVRKYWTLQLWGMPPYRYQDIHRALSQKRGFTRWLEIFIATTLLRNLALAGPFL